MANPLTDTPTTEPTEIVAGDTVSWKRSGLATDYPPASYALTYRARRLGEGAVQLLIAATESGDDYLVTVAATITAAWKPGTYAWDAYMTRSSDSARVRIDSGTFIVHPNRAASTDDPRSHARKVLDAIEAVIEGRATQDQMSYSIAGRTLSRMPIADLLAFRSQYKAEVAREEAAERIANGLGLKSKIAVRFTRP